MDKLSVVIITLNESRNIARCIKSVTEVADEIIVIDSFSNDGTCEIAGSMGAMVVQCEWQGYSATKNAGAMLAKNNWILSIDADEALSEELINSILALKNKGLKPACFNRITNYCGRWIKHCGWYPDTKFRIYHREHYAWEGLIHEHIKPLTSINSKPQLLQGDCYHYSYYTIEEHKQQTLKFAKLSAEHLHNKGKRFSLLKRNVLPLVKFMQLYIFKLGFLDGQSGLTICLISAKAVQLKHDYLRALS